MGFRIENGEMLEFYLKVWQQKVFRAQQRADVL